MSAHDFLTLSSDDEDGDSDFEILSESIAPRNISKVITELTSVEKSRLLTQLNIPENAMVRIRVVGSLSDRKGLEGGGVTAHCRVLKEGRLVQQTSLLGQNVFGQNVFGPRKNPLKASVNDIMTISSDESEPELSPVRKRKESGSKQVLNAQEVFSDNVSNGNKDQSNQLSLLEDFVSNQTRLNEILTVSSEESEPEEPDEPDPRSPARKTVTKHLLSQFRQETLRRMRRATGHGEVEEVTVQKSGYQMTVPVQIESCRIEKLSSVQERIPVLSDNHQETVIGKESSPEQFENDLEENLSDDVANGIIDNPNQFSSFLIGSLSCEMTADPASPDPVSQCSDQVSVPKLSSLHISLPLDANDTNLLDNFNQNHSEEVSSVNVDKRSDQINVTIDSPVKPDHNQEIVSSKENHESHSITRSFSGEFLAQCSLYTSGTNVESSASLKTNTMSRTRDEATTIKPVVSSRVSPSSSSCPAGYVQEDSNIAANEEVAKVKELETEAISKEDLFGIEGTLRILPARLNTKNVESNSMSDVQDPVRYQQEKSALITVQAELVPGPIEGPLVPFFTHPTLEISEAKSGQLFLSVKQLSQLFPAGTAVDVMSVCNKLSEDFIWDGWSMSHISLVAVVRMLKKFGDVFGLKEEFAVKMELAELEKRMDLMVMRDTDQSVSKKFCSELEGKEKFLGGLGLCRTELVICIELEIKSRTEEARTTIRLRSGSRRKQWQNAGVGTVVGKRARGSTPTISAVSRKGGVGLVKKAKGKKKDAHR